MVLTLALDSEVHEVEGEMHLTVEWRNSVSNGQLAGQRQDIPLQSARLREMIVKQGQWYIGESDKY